ncbi:MAG: metal ABC transporter permease [Spirochaetes bacterium]|nr:metal ABC transporter permease [Spirochaetota bacterium]MBU0955250.1 metal ABC transporter permease [Spirochaetota bacterium]
MSELLRLLALPPVRNAFIGMLAAGATFSLLGVVIVSLHLSSIRFVCMHTGLLGAAIGLALGFSPALGALLLVLLVSLLLGLRGGRQAVSSNSLMGIFMTGSLALTFIMLAAASVPAMDVFSVFTGNILMLGRADLYLVFAAGLVVLAVFLLAFRELQLVLLDPELAAAQGVPVRLVNIVLYVLVGTGVAVALRLVGALLVDAIILLPAVAALRTARSFVAALVLSSLFGLLACAGGFIMALLLDWPIGASTAAVAVLILIGQMAVSRIIIRS